MTWAVNYSARADEDLSKLERTDKERVVCKIKDTKENPHHFFERLVGLPHYKLRVGEYRIIADLEDKIKIIAILRIGHRKKVYREI